MINIKSGEDNNVFLTLNEKTVYANGFYFLRLRSNENTNVVKDMELKVDISNNINRYNEYIIVENKVEDLNNQIIHLPDASYDYSVYNTTGNVIDDTSKIIETGLLLVDFREDINNTNITYTNTNNSDDITYK